VPRHLRAHAHHPPHPRTRHRGLVQGQQVSQHRTLLHV
jgi:hypothetical protein